jgi:xanthine dehydrogenase D subunit
MDTQVRELDQDELARGELAQRRLARGGVGASLPRADGAAKVSGEFGYASDLHADGMLHGAVLRSPHARARIRSVDVSAAKASPGVRAVLLAADVPGQPTFGLNVADQPVLAADVVNYQGEPVALVAADTQRLAQQAICRIAVDWEPLEVLADMEAALRPDAPRLREFGNVLRHVHLAHGDPDGATADVWVDGYYQTAMQDQAPLGPEAGLAIPDQDGGVHLYVASQWLHVDAEQIAPCLGLPAEKVRLTLAGVGGAFGAREDIHIQIHACLLALRTGRPVKMCLGRTESFHGHVHRHPARIWMRHGAASDGRLLVVDARLLFDGGAYTSSSPAVIGNAVTFAAGPYEVPHVRVEGSVVYTNNPPCGAMRGFGAPQVCFAHEAQMDKLAARLGLDPVEFRLRNAVHTGSVLPTGQVITGSAPVRELIERCMAIPLPAGQTRRGRDVRRYPGGTGNVTHGEGLRRGVAIAVGFKNFAFSEGFDDSAAARVTLTAGPGGPVAEIHTAAVEMGQGLYTVLSQIATTELGVSDVVMHAADTEVGNAGSTSASRQTVMAGGAVQLACRRVREELFERAGRLAGAGGHFALADGKIMLNGLRVADVGDLLTEPAVGAGVYHHRPTTEFDASGQGDIHAGFAFAAERAVVEVDAELGLARVVQVAAAMDVGKVMNPIGLQGQVAGGTAQGLGLALMEEVQVRDGIIRNPSFTDYLIPTILDVPPVLSAAVEEPEPGTPYGVKGIGESPTVVATAAIVAALRDATGLELNSAPVTPDELAGLRGPAVTAGRAPVPEVPGQWPVPYYYDERASGQLNLM